MIKLAADVEKCEGYANCVIAASEFYDIDDDGKVQLMQTVADENDREKLAEAVRSCPTAAIWLEDE
ncbi:ferredoxin [Haloechinothrix salitolerans]|uniref:Ferredoxin n=1 Tax=Haloechinothrix salitolerans TaxID=926830 RepID=A0ABW2C276_9PSEU